MKGLNVLRWGLCGVLLAGGCAAAHTGLQVWQEPPLVLSFTVKMQERKEFPMQGGMEIRQDGGSMALISQHGLTLGQCTWRHEQHAGQHTRQQQPISEGREGQQMPIKVPSKEPEAQAAQGPSAMPLICTAAQGLGGPVLSLVKRVALANYRIAYVEAHGPSARPLGPYTLEKQGEVYLYSDNSGILEIKIAKRPLL